MYQDEPVQYPVDRRPPRDWFSPIAAPVATLLCWLAILGSIAIIAYGSYNLGARVPTVVPTPEHSTYEQDTRNIPDVDLTVQELTRLTVTVRNRDRAPLMLQVHDAISARGGAIVSGYIHQTDPDGRVVLNPVTNNGSTYHIPKAYLPELQQLAKPGWKRPMAYANWVPEQRAQALTDPTSGELSAYVVITTKHLMFEDRRNQVVTLTGTATIILTFITAFVLSTLATSTRHRF